jgi:ribA/ribD-fused uncharacterized protein
MRWVTFLVLFGLFPVCGCVGDPPHAPTTLPSTAPAKITEFQGDYRFLSNFYPATVEFEGITYPSVEHAYQAAKTLDMNQRRRIAAIPEPADAKKAGRALNPQRPDWDKVKFLVMEECVRYKFAHDLKLRAKLLATGSAILEEGNNWNDRIWGICPPNSDNGENHLGKILMRVRAELRSR